MDGENTKVWQQTLKDMGLYSGAIDGDFGAGTRRASFEALAKGIVPPNASRLVMTNQSATRNRPITDNLRDNLITAVTAVYGPNCKIAVYSGGQDRQGQGNRRTGSIRHDDYGKGGRAADLYVYVAGRKIFGEELAKLGQFWLAAKLGGCGLEMATGGIHLDEWTSPPPGGGMLWTYAYSDNKSWGKTVRAMLEAGSRGVFP